MAPPITLHCLLLLIITLSSSILVHCTLVDNTRLLSRVPKNKTFRFTYHGDSGGLIQTGVNEVKYRFFRLLFHNTGPDAYVLGIALYPYDDVEKLWVWEANPKKTVRKNSTLTFGGNGNLVLRDVDGRTVWQTKTANKGVTGISMQENGNLVLHDDNGRFVWQSFQHPTDSLLKGQSLFADLKGAKKLVSANGVYSSIVDKNGFSLYRYDSGNYTRYGGWEASGLTNVTFDSFPINPSRWGASGTTIFLMAGFAKQESAKTATTRHLLGFDIAPAPEPEAPLRLTPSEKFVLATRDYDIAHSVLKLESDGDLVLYDLYLLTDDAILATDYSYLGRPWRIIYDKKYEYE